MELRNPFNLRVRATPFAITTAYNITNINILCPAKPAALALIQTLRSHVCGNMNRRKHAALLGIGGKEPADTAILCVTFMVEMDAHQKSCYHWYRCRVSTTKVA